MLYLFKFKQFPSFSNFTSFQSYCVPMQFCFNSILFLQAFISKTFLVLKFRCIYSIYISRSHSVSFPHTTYASILICMLKILFLYHFGIRVYFYCRPLPFCYCRRIKRSLHAASLKTNEKEIKVSSALLPNSLATVAKTSHQ